MKPGTSISTRLVMLFLIADFILIIGFVIGIYVYMDRRLTRSFDAALRANAEAMATLVKVEENDRLELDFSDEVMTRFSKTKHPDLFAILDKNGKMVERSLSLKSTPDWVGVRKKAEWRDFEIGNDDYRQHTGGIQLAIR
ncbi:MAG: sensor histidine kinase N-terminal domain-containing protein, partial [Candidatus Sumerlaeota bacterium]